MEQFIGVLSFRRYDVISNAKGLERVSDSQWIDKIHRGSNESRYQFCVDSNNHVLYIRDIQEYSGRDLMDPDSFSHVALVSRRKLFLRELDPTSRTHRRWKRLQKKTTESILHIFSSFWTWNTRRIRWLFEFKKSLQRGQVDNFSGCNLLD